jgi:hypothetical protein
MIHGRSSRFILIHLKEKVMDDYGRLMRVLQGRSDGILPWYADLSYLYSSLDQKGTMEERFKGEGGYLQFHQELGAGICFYAPSVWKETYNDKIQQVIEEKDGVRIETIHTSRGSVRQVWRYLPTSYTWAITEYFIKDIADLRIMLEASENRIFETNIDEYLKVHDRWADTGYAVGIAPVAGAPIQRMLTRWAGVMGTMNIYMDAQKELEEIMKALEDCDDPIWDICCKSQCFLFEFPENLSAEVTGRHFFETYNMPYYKKRTSALHKAGKKTSIHNDGSLRGTFDLLGLAGFDVIEAITPSPIGDIPLEELRDVAGPNVVLWGGLPGAIFSPCYSEEDFEFHLQKTVRIFREDGRCVLGVADQVPPDALISRVKRVREVVEA